jgi:hypothetical protein
MWTKPELDGEPQKTVAELPTDESAIYELPGRGEMMELQAEGISTELEGSPVLHLPTRDPTTEGQDVEPT